MEIIPIVDRIVAHLRCLIEITKTHQLWVVLLLLFLLNGIMQLHFSITISINSHHFPITLITETLIVH